MGSIYQLIFFLAIALLAIVITVFVLAVSLLGRAVKLSAQEQTEAEEKRKKDTEKEIKKIQDKLEKAKAAGRVDVKDLTRSLQDLESRDTRHKWKLRWIKIKPKLLTASWGALIPGALFLISAIFSALAFNLPSGTATVSLYTLISLIALGIGICFVCLTLKVIQGVAITSEETAFVRQKDMYKAALIEFEDERRPRLELEFPKTTFPLKMKTGSEITLRCQLSLSKGLSADAVDIHIGFPKGFQFVDTTNTYTIESYRKDIDFVFKRWTTNTLIQGLVWDIKAIKVKTPSTAGKFEMICSFTCRGSPPEYKRLDVVLE